RWMSTFDHKGRRCGERRRLSLEDQREFDRWLIANAILGLIISGGMLAMALAGLDSVAEDLIRRWVSGVAAAKLKSFLILLRAASWRVRFAPRADIRPNARVYEYTAQ